MRFLPTSPLPTLSSSKMHRDSFVMQNRIYVRYNYPEIGFGTRTKVRRCWVVVLSPSAAYCINSYISHEIYRINS